MEDAVESHPADRRNQTQLSSQRGVFVICRTPSRPALIHPFCNTRSSPGMERPIESDNL